MSQMTLFSIKKQMNDPDCILLPSSLFASCQVYQEFAFGTKQCFCKIKRSKDDKTIYIGESIWNELMIPYESTAHVFFQEGIVHIGPLVGIFTAGFTGNILRPVGDRSLFFANFLSGSKKVGVFSFVFGANHIQWETGTIKGLFHQSDGWKQIEVPFPNVVYDRLPNRKTENHTPLKKIKNILQSQYFIPWFNPRFFNKWELYQILNTYPETKIYLPETIRNPSIQDIKKLFNKYEHLYLKPIHGSLGFGIYQIIKEKETWHCRFYKNNKNYFLQYSSLEILLQKHFHSNILHGYVAQQGISLIQVANKPIDFRIHTNKDESGKWKMSAIAAKIAGSGSITTHMRSGGSVKTIEEILKLIPTLSQAIVHNFEQAVLTISTILEKELNGIIGEIGFDLGMDTKGNIWFFEANSKPGRSIFKNGKLKKFDLLTRSLPFSFAFYLTKTALKDPEVLFHDK